MKAEIKYVGSSCNTYVHYCNICNHRIETNDKENDYNYCPYCGRKIGEEYDA